MPSLLAVRLARAGLNDYSYPCSSIADCGAVISQAMGNQTQWVRQRQPDADIVTYLWDEGLKYLEVRC